MRWSVVSLDGGPPDGGVVEPAWPRANAAVETIPSKPPFAGVPYGERPEQPLFLLEVAVQLEKYPTRIFLDPCEILTTITLLQAKIVGRGHGG
jgi:hypothetical protein